MPPARHTVTREELALNPHLSPEALATLPRPYPWHLLTGADFARAIRSARAHPNQVVLQIQAARSAKSAL